MSSTEKSTPPPDPATCYFTRTALLTLPPQWRTPMVHLGQALYEIGLEIFGICPESPGGIECTCHQLIAFAGDLRILGDQLAAMGAEPESSDMSDRERDLCRLAGSYAPNVREIARRLLDAGRGIGPDGRPA